MGGASLEYYLIPSLKYRHILSEVTKAAMVILGGQKLALNTIYI